MMTAVDSLSRRRPLHILPFDPMLDRFGRAVVAEVPFERLSPGPSGRLVQVIDYDAGRDCFYEPIDLDDPAVLLNQGFGVSEADPRFHQQMVYAVVMRVLDAFERGLGRPFEWRGRTRLRVYPHAFEGPNAYFDEELFALAFGYFEADAQDPGPNLPGQYVFTCLSHDIVAHETTHAVLKRLRPHYSNPTNPDVLAFHEGFADVVAILHHFKYPAVVAETVAQTRSDLSEATSLLSLAGQFGFAKGDQGPLRTALTRPDKNAYHRAQQDHTRGAVLAAAVIDGFLQSYREAVAPLIRLATAGSGVLQPGALHPDLVARVTAVAAQTADRMLNMCIQAFDYLPPVDVTFSDYLRALVTADFDLFPEDESHLRGNVIEAFRARGIYPRDVISLAGQSLRLARADPSEFMRLPLFERRLLDSALQFDRRRRAQSGVAVQRGVIDDKPQSRYIDPDAAGWATPDNQKAWAVKLHSWAIRQRGQLQLDPTAPVRVAGFFTGQRLDADGFVQSRVVAQFTQQRADLRDAFGGVTPMGGATVVADGEGEVRYVVSKKLPTPGSEQYDLLAAFVADVEHRLRSIAWSGDPKMAVIQRLNLRNLDAPY